MFRSKPVMVTRDTALVGTADAVQVPDRHAVLGTPLDPPVARGHESSTSPWAASGAPSGSSGRPPACSPPPSATWAAGPQPDVRGDLHRPDRPHRDRQVVYDPARWTSTCCSRRSGRTTTRPSSTARATTSARSTAGDLPDDRGADAAVRASLDALPGGADEAGYGAITTQMRPSPRPGRSTTPRPTTRGTCTRTPAATATTASARSPTTGRT